ncbi:MAG TPA: tetratricopeptide repeat protein [Candidatus Paceibacterota bacterium]|nr:tetratricopeptide repeat protein [Candidatus Paceibacterota bacterium]HRZ55097.1 tetratricopeptide repeat protein [Candidatus Paceibacterota bacterium]
MQTIKKWGGAPAVDARPSPPGIAGCLLGLLALLVLAGCAPPERRSLLEGERLLRQGRPLEAIQPLQKAVNLLATNAPACAQAWNFLGLAYHYAQQPAGAAQAYQNALARDFNLTVVRYNRGCLFLEQNNLPAAINELTTYTTYQPKDLLGWARLGSAQLRARLVEQAERSFQRVLELNPTPIQTAEALNNLGLCAALRRRSDDAFKYFNSALRQQTNFPPTLLNQAIVAHQQINDRTLALDRYRAYLAASGPLPHAEAVSNLAGQIEGEFRLRAAATSAVPVLVLVTNLPAQPTNAVLVAATSPQPAPSATNPPPSPVQPTPSPSPTNIARVAAAPAPVPEPAPVEPAPSVAPEPQTQTFPAIVAQAPPAPSVRTEPTMPVPEPVPTPEPVPAATPEALTERTPVTETTTPVEVVRLESEPEVKAAQDIAVPSRIASATTTVTSAPTAPTPTPAAVPEATTASAPPPARSAPDSIPTASRPQQPKKKTLVQRLNPLGWFGGKDKAEKESAPRVENATTPLRDLGPLARETAAAPRPAQAALPVAATPAVAPPKPEPPVFLRYTYLRPETPVSGDRVRAQEALTRGVQSHTAGRHDQAVAAYKQAVGADPSFFEAQYNLGVAAFDAGDWAEALAAFERALVLKPDDPDARLNFALSLDRADYPVDSARELDLLLARAPETVDAHATLARLCAEKLGDPDKARVHYTKVLQLDPRHPQAAAIRRWLTVNRPRP